MNLIYVGNVSIHGFEALPFSTLELFFFHARISRGEPLSSVQKSMGFYLIDP